MHEASAQCACRYTSQGLGWLPNVSESVRACSLLFEIGVVIVHSQQLPGVNTLDLLGKDVCYEGEVGVVVARSEPAFAGRDRLAWRRGRSVTIRIEGILAPHFVEVAESDLHDIEVL